MCWPAPPRISSSARQQRRPQLVQRPPAQRDADEQAVRLQRPADLDQRAGQIVDPVQRQRRDDEVERPVGERQRLLVACNAQRRRQEGRRKVGGDDVADAVPGLRIGAQRSPGKAVMSSEVKHALEPAIDCRKPQGDVFRCGLFQERVGVKAGCGSRPSARMQAAIEDTHRVCVVGGRAIGRRGRGCRHQKTM